ncbi:Saccharopine dehydrogenase [Mycena indigotica]|uniref:Saccharopine dehydrogenase n=1 Tax=Mycena indigotica TaxID=2126181 RepID=A0A8H6VV99_9AGAR|nr:Saccharopine dehydrogenase [Mycena indigotica]KAF7295172.1 Saccharopine dehydrogenase [Mycena indigotica]
MSSAMSVDPKPYKLNLDEFIATATSATPSELHPFFDDFRVLYNKKLWHQLTLKLFTFLDHPASKPYRVDVFESFVRDFETKINPLRLVEMGVRVSKEIDNPQTHLNFLTSLLSRITAAPSKSEEAHVLLLATIARAKLLYGDLEGTKADMDKAWSVLDRLEDVDNGVNAAYYQVAGDYYKAKGEYAPYYRHSLLYLACVPNLETDLTSEDRLARAHDLAISAFLGDTIYNFGELLMHPILDSLDKTPHEWIKKLLFTFNEGNIGKFEALAPLFPKEPILQSNYAFLRQKICLMALIESVFKRAANDRTMSFQTIAEETRLPLDEVEHLVMKALSLKLIRGSLDQVDQKAQITWVQPRVLSREQIGTLATTLGDWVAKLQVLGDGIPRVTATFFFLSTSMAPLSHPAIRDGWFREISSQWPGQAMTLRVVKVLHVEKSAYQDVLVFESETYGNVLVLDGVIQCTERDEFSYQEMIAHLPLASHPNPKNVLVIGGGDGGVVREVLKHSSVQKVVLCDIDEAVVRVSKQYLPHMSSLLSDPRVTVFIGDGFKFLEENKASYDVIVTDSSDPVGPAEALFQKPYFELLHGALSDGGSISTQGECLWLHLPLITQNHKTVKSLFPVCEYAYTTIPTYPSGQIGFVIATKDASRDLRKPIRDVQGTRYYNRAVHSAAFTLPEFGRAILEEGKDVRPVFGRAAKEAQTNGKSHKILLLGSGFVALPCAEYLTRDPSNHLTVACRTLATAQAFSQNLPSTTAISLDVNDAAALEAAVAAHDLVISLIPYTHHAAVIKAAIKGKTNVVTTSYVSPAMRELDAAAREAGIIVLNEVGLDPGIDHLYAVKTIEEVHAKGGKIKHFLSYCGGLPAPEASGNPLGYKFSWSSRGVLLALLNSASFLSSGAATHIPGEELMSHAKPYFISPAFAFVAYPNRDSLPFQQFYNIPEAETVVRGTLRYQGFPEFIAALVKLGWLNSETRDWLVDGIDWKTATQKACGASDSSESSLVSQIKQLCSFPNEFESERIISGLRWIGLFSAEKVVIRSGNLLDTLCARLEGLMKYEAGERDLVMLQHKFIVEWADGSKQTLTSTLEAYGTPGGHSAMALTVGLPCGIATQLVLDGILKTPGVHAPYSKEICDPIRERLESEGLGLVERVL